MNKKAIWICNHWFFCDNKYCEHIIKHIKETMDIDGDVTDCTTSPCGRLEKNALCVLDLS
jgi:hypothetical protein